MRETRRRGRDVSDDVAAVTACGAVKTLEMGCVEGETADVG